MRDLPRQKLSELLAQHGHSLCDDAPRLEALLNDVLRNEHKAEREVLVVALREGIPQQLRSRTSGMPNEALAAKLVQQLRHNRRLDEEAARWGVESWALALGLRITLPPARPANPAPKVETPKPRAAAGTGVDFAKLAMQQATAERERVRADQEKAQLQKQVEALSGHVLNQERALAELAERQTKVLAELARDVPATRTPTQQLAQTPIAQPQTNPAKAHAPQAQLPPKTGRSKPSTAADARNRLRQRYTDPPAPPMPAPKTQRQSSPGENGCASVIGATIVIAAAYWLTSLLGSGFPWTSTVLGVLLGLGTIAAAFDAKLREEAGVYGFIFLFALSCSLFRTGRAEIVSNNEKAAQAQKANFVGNIPPPVPPINPQPPSVQILSVEPAEPKAGDTLSIRLTGSDPDGGALSYEYRVGTDGPWRATVNDRISLPDLAAGTLSLEVRAVDAQGNFSSPESRTLIVQSLARPPEITNTIGMKLVLVPAGEFLMGSPDSDASSLSHEKPRHRVRITKAFYLQTTEATQGQWEAVMGTRPWTDQTFAKKGADYPATYVSWQDAMEFCRTLSTLEEEEYRLPTEAEWEYACRAGTQTVYSFGDSDDQLDQYAWYFRNAKNTNEAYPHRVGQKQPNAWGLYDMHGNVWEWCQDWYDEGYYAISVAIDPAGPSSESATRVNRGGGWDLSPQFARSAYRQPFSPGYRCDSVGFRVARSSVGRRQVTKTQSRAQHLAKAAGDRVWPDENP